MLKGTQRNTNNEQTLEYVFCASEVVQDGVKMQPRRLKLRPRCPKMEDTWAKISNMTYKMQLTSSKMRIGGGPGPLGGWGEEGFRPKGEDRL